MTDISIRLGELLESTCDPATSEACRDAIMEINFLRAENARLRLTAEEREAVAGVIAVEHQRGAWKWAETLRKMLERLGGER